MSSLGFAIVFLSCAAGGECEPTGIRVSRFADLGQCRATLPAVVSMLRKSEGGGSASAACRSLEELCASRSASHPVRMTSAGVPAGMDAPLAILCRPPPEADCSG